MTPIPRSPATAPRHALLVHGLGRTPLSLAYLGRTLARAGLRPGYFGYYAWAESHSRILERLSARLAALAPMGPVTLVGHSLGGLLLRQAVPRIPGLQVQHLVMLGTPNQPPRMARRADRWPPFRLLTRSCGRALADPAVFAALPEPTYPCTVIAGDRGRTGRWSFFGDDRNDGFVAVDEAWLAPQTPLLVLPVRHTFMMNDAAVQAAVLAAAGVPR